LAKSTWKVNDSDLAKLPALVQRNPHYHSAASMQLFFVDDVKQLSLAKHGEEGLAKKIARSENLKKKREETKRVAEEKAHEAHLAFIKKIEDDKKAALEAALKANPNYFEDLAREKAEKDAAKEARKVSLVEALQKQGLTLRSDSQLCSNYIMEGTGNISEIVQIMAEMNFYHAKTDYRELLRGIINNNRDVIFGYRGEDSDGERGDIEEYKVVARNRALKNWLWRNKDPERWDSSVPQSIRKATEPMLESIRSKKLAVEKKRKAKSEQKRQRKRQKKNEANNNNNDINIKNNN